MSDPSQDHPIPAVAGTKDHAFAAIRWTAFAHVGQMVLQFALTVWLARLLGPGEFGLLAMAVVFTNLANVFQQLGLGAALVQRPDATRRHEDAAFWGGLAVGMGLTALLAGLSPAAAWFFGEPRLATVLSVLAVSFTLSAAGSVPRALLTRGMAFRALGIMDITSALAGGVAAVVLAAAGAGVWSLIAQSIVGTAVGTVLQFARGHWRPAFRFRTQDLRELLGFGIHFTGVGFLNYLYRNLDNLLVGRFLGPVALGLYDFAYRAFRIPMTSLQAVLNRVMFPVLSSLQHDLSRLARGYREAFRIVSAATLPGFSLLFVLAPDFVPTVYGPRWTGAVPVLQALAVAGFAQSMTMTLGWVFQALGQTRLLLRLSLTLALLPTAVAILIGLYWGILGVAWATAAVSAALAYPTLDATARLMGLRARHLLGDLRGVFVASVAAGAVAWLVRSGTAGWPHAGRLVAGATAGAMAAFLGLLWSDRLLVTQAREAVARFLPGRRARPKGA